MGEAITVSQSGLSLAEMSATIQEAAATVLSQHQEIKTLRSVLVLALPALRKFIAEYDDYVSNHDGEQPLDGPDCGCIDCTLGTVPNDKNTGRCAYHLAVAAIAKVEAHS